MKNTKARKLENRNADLQYVLPKAFSEIWKTGHLGRTALGFSRDQSGPEIHMRVPHGLASYVVC